MPYVSSYRGREYFKGGHTRTVRTLDGKPDKVTTMEFSSPTVIEAVYSWRTGARAVSDPALSNHRNSGYDDWGIATPRRGGTTASQLADRKRYYESVMGAAFPAETASGSVSTDRFSKTDSGHVFQNVVFSRWPVRFQYLNRVNTWPSYGTSQSGICFLQTAQTPVIAGGDRTFGFTSRSVSLMTPTERQGMFNRYFAATAPDKKDAALMVTLIELLRGDIPSIIANFRKAALKYRAADTRAYERRSTHRKYKDVANYAGGEYLNVVFGWSPLIADLAGLLKVLITIDRMVYSETNRRQRQWTGPSTTTVVQTTRGWAHRPSGSTSDAEFDKVSGDTAYLTIGNAQVEEKVFLSEDYRLSSRYSSIAKPDSASNGFVERAEEILARLGLVDDPTLVWELVPWSWLVDWVVNIGNSITNARTYSPKTGKYAIDYAYVTTKLVETKSIDIKSAGLASTVKSFTPIRSNGYHICVAKTRDRATPFGFGTQLASLDAGKFAILVALGMAQAR